MRIWDVSPGYLNRQSLLGEHRELHGLRVVVAQHRKGYSRHPETLRWASALSGLACRHAQLVAEMRLRGYADRTPLRSRAAGLKWPAGFVTEPADQFALLRRKYVAKSKGRIPLPRTAQELWAQHKYSVLARDPSAYRTIGRSVAQAARSEARDRFRGLAADLVGALREPAPAGRLANALEHMWGHVAPFATAADKAVARRGGPALLAAIQALAVRHAEPFLLASTALSDLAVCLQRALDLVRVGPLVKRQRP